MMQAINLNAVACPHDGTSGAENLNASSQIEYTGHVDGEGWINCPTCGAVVEFTESGEVTMASGVEPHEWSVQLGSAIEGTTMADAMAETAGDGP